MLLTRKHISSHSWIENTNVALVFFRPVGMLSNIDMAWERNGEQLFLMLVLG
jgi:hypothetical protein